jgi:hypothetical protein
MPGFSFTKITNEFNVATPGYDGGYKYGGKFADNSKHDPWVWVHNKDVTAPHLTLWTNDFNDAGMVKRCHLSYTYNALPGREVHVYFNVHPVSGVVSFSNIDANRCNSDADSATKAAEKNKDSLRQLAADLLAGAFPA